MASAQDFDAFVQSRYAALARTAMLLTGARASGEDLLQEALIRTYLAWPKVRESAAADGYVRTTMVRLRRPWPGHAATQRAAARRRAPRHPWEDPMTTVRDLLKRAVDTEEFVPPGPGLYAAATRRRRRTRAAQLAGGGVAVAVVTAGGLGAASTGILPFFGGSTAAILAVRTRRPARAASSSPPASRPSCAR